MKVSYWHDNLINFYLSVNSIQEYFLFFLFKSILIITTETKSVCPLNSICVVFFCYCSGPPYVLKVDICALIFLLTSRALLNCCVKFFFCPVGGLYYSTLSSLLARYLGIWGEMWNYERYECSNWGINLMMILAGALTMSIHGKFVIDLINSFHNRVVCRRVPHIPMPEASSGAICLNINSISCRDILCSFILPVYE